MFLFVRVLFGLDVWRRAIDKIEECAVTDDRSDICGSLTVGVAAVSGGCVGGVRGACRARVAGLRCEEPRRKFRGWRETSEACSGRSRAEFGEFKKRAGYI
jgi:hypothetical protein